MLSWRVALSPHPGILPSAPCGKDGSRALLESQDLLLAQRSRPGSPWEVSCQAGPEPEGLGTQGPKDGNCPCLLRVRLPASSELWHRNGQTLEWAGNEGPLVQAPAEHGLADWKAGQDQASVMWMVRRTWPGQHTGSYPNSRHQARVNHVFTQVR